MLVHFSITVSRLSDQNKVLAQRLALLRRRLEQEDLESRGGEALIAAPREAQTG